MTCWLLQNTIFFTGKRLLWPSRGPVIARFLMVALKGFHLLLLGAANLVCHQHILRIFLVLMGQLMVLMVLVLVMLVLVMLLVLLGELPQSFCLPKGASHAEDRHQDWDLHYTLLATHVSIAHWHLHVDSSRLYAGHRENLPSIGLR